MQPFKISFANFPYKEGDILPLTKQTKTSFMYSNNPFTGYDIGISENKMTGEYMAYVAGVYSTSEKNIPNFKGKKTTLPAEDCSKCFKKEFIYNGRVDDGLKFIYREFYGDLIRPSFTQELQYDLSQSDVIGFKGLRIKVMNATNSTITYSVLNVFQ